MEHLKTIERKLAEACFLVKELKFEDGWNEMSKEKIKTLARHYNHWLDEFEKFALMPVDNRPNRIDLQFVALGGARGVLCALISIDKDNEKFYEDKLKVVKELEIEVGKCLNRYYHCI